MTQGTLDRSRRGLAVERAAAAYATVAAEALARELAAAGNIMQPKGFPIAGWVLREGESLKLDRKRLEVTDQACERLRAERRELCRRRDQATRALYREVGQVRRTVKLLVGAERAKEHLGAGGDTVRAPHHLLIQAGHVVHLLADSPQPFRLLGDDGVTIAGPELVCPLRLLIDDSRQSLRAVAVARRREDAALSAKRRATVTFDQRLKRLGHRLETLLDAGGLHSLAETVRPWAGRRGRPPKERRLDTHPDLVARGRPALADDIAAQSAIAERRYAQAGEGAAMLEPLATRAVPESPKVDASTLRNATHASKARSSDQRTGVLAATSQVTKTERRRRGWQTIPQKSEKRQCGSRAGHERNRERTTRVLSRARRNRETRSRLVADGEKPRVCRIYSSASQSAQTQIYCLARIDTMAIAKIFRSGHSQTVRLPKAFRFPPETKEVAVCRQGERIVLEPVAQREWPETFWQAFGDMPKGFERPA